MLYSIKISTRYTDKTTEVSYDLPAIRTADGILVSHLRYLAWHSGKSESWRERSTFSVRLLIDYVESRGPVSNATETLRAFTEALVSGTTNPATGDDPLQLFWKPRRLDDAENILFLITHYTDFLASQEGHDALRVNPFRKATGWEERLNWCAYYHKHANVFLNHLSSRTEAARKAAQQRLIQTPISMLVRNDKSDKFPESHLAQLLYEGFETPKGIDYRSIAQTMLLNFGGLRKSERFHIYTSDIQADPNRPDEALVRVYHPEYGRSPHPGYKTRKEFLNAETAYKPRNQYRLSQRLHAGWKSPLMTSRDGYFDIIFNPPSKASEFLEVWIKYLTLQRPSQAESHPFAFSNDNGLPDTVKNFQRRHRNAVERIGLECSKELGTTEHGHRHAYGYRAHQCALSPAEIQKAMHHKSPNSCLVYINPTNEDVRQAMRKFES